MGEFSIIHWLIVLFVLGLFVVLPPVPCVSTREGSRRARRLHKGPQRRAGIAKVISSKVPERIMGAQEGRDGRRDAERESRSRNPDAASDERPKGTETLGSRKIKEKEATDASRPSQGRPPMKKMLPVVLGTAIAADAVMVTRHSDALAPQPHTELEITAPLATTVSPISSSGGAGGPATGFDIRQIS